MNLNESTAELAFAVDVLDFSTPSPSPHHTGYAHEFVCEFEFDAFYASLYSTCYDYDFVPNIQSIGFVCKCVGAFVYVSYGIVSKWEMICCFTFNSITTIYVLIYSISSRYTFAQSFLTYIYSHTVSQPASYEMRTKCIHFIHCGSFSSPRHKSITTNKPKLD